MRSPRLPESAGILPLSCQEHQGIESPGWRQAKPTAVGWARGVTGQLSDSVRRLLWSDQRKFCVFLAFLSCICDSSIKGTSLNKASTDRLISQLHNNIQFNVLTFLEVVSFHVHKLHTIILCKHMNFYLVIKLIYILTKY